MAFVNLPIPQSARHLLSICQFTLFALCLLLFASAHAKTPPVLNVLNLQQLAVGEVTTLYWRGLPVLVYKRTAAQIAKLNQASPTQLPPWRKLDLYRAQARKSGNQLASLLLAGTDPLDGTKLRSQRPDILVVLAISTNFGCVIEWQADSQQFVDPCSGTRYGVDGRIIQATARERFNLLIPVHRFKGDVLTVGDAAEQGVTIHDFAPNILQLTIPAGEKLLEAIEWQKPDLISELLKDPTVLDYHTVTGATAIHFAAAEGAPSLLTQLHNAGFRLDVTTNEGVTPLMIALMQLNADNARWLVEHGASIVCQCYDKSCSASEYLQQSHGYLTSTEQQAFLEKAGLAKAGSTTQIPPNRANE